MVNYFRNNMYLLLSVCFSSCTAQSSYDAMHFTETITLSGKELTIENVYLKYPFRIRLEGSNLFVTDLHPPDHYCHWFDYPSMEYQTGFAKRGEGPHEYLDVENIRFDADSSVWILDANNRKIAKFRTDAPENTDTKIDLSKELIRTLDFEVLNDSVFIVPDYTGENRLCFIDRQGKIQKKAFSIPVPENNRKGSDVMMAQAWRSFINYNPDLGILATVTQLGQVVEIYDIPNDSLIRVINQQAGAPRFQIKGGYAIPDGIMGYSDVHVGNENIYAVFWGHSFDDIKRNKIENEGGRFIHVFDLEGNPVRRYLLDRYITGFCIDEEQKRIIALDVNSDQPIIEYSYL